MSTYTHAPILALIATAPGLEGQAPIKPVHIAERCGDVISAAILRDLGSAVESVYSTVGMPTQTRERMAIATAIESVESALASLRALDDSLEA